MKNNKSSKNINNLNIENRTIGLKNKLGIIAIVFLLIFAGHSGVNATIKLGEDGSGQKWFGTDPGLITNSNGKAWTATGANIQAAIWDLNGTGGIVIIPPAVTLTASSTINVLNYVTLYISPKATVQPSGDFDIIHLYPGGKICGGGAVSAYNQHALPYNSSCIRLDTDYGDYHMYHHTTIEDITIGGDTTDPAINSCGIYIYSDNISQTDVIGDITCRNLYFGGNYYGIREHLNHSSGEQYINLCRYNKITFYFVTKGYYQEKSDSAGLGLNDMCNQQLSSITFQSATADTDAEALHIEGCANIVDDIVIYDIHNDAFAVNVSGDSNTIKGWWGTNSVILLDTGYDNHITNVHDHNYSEAYDVRYSTNFDSSTSTTAGIQEAINDLPVTGGKVIVPSGTHSTSQYIYMKNNVTLEGYGSGTIIETGNSSAIKIDGDSHNENITIRDLRIDGTNNTADDSLIEVITNYPNHIRIENVEIIGSSSTSECIWISNAHNVTVTNCFLTDAKTGIYVKYGGCENIIISECHLAGGSDYGIYFGYSPDETLVDNVIIENYKVGILIYSGENITISNSRILSSTGNDLAGAEQDANIRLYGSCKNIIIDGNQILSGLAHGIRLENSSNCTVTSNIVRYNTGIGISKDANCNYNIINDNMGCDYDSLQDGYIWNSNGKYWGATGANIQLAIDNLGSDGGTVWLPAGDFTITDDISIGEPGIIIKGSGINSTYIVASGVGGSYPAGVIYVHATGGISPNGFTLSDLTLDAKHLASTSCLSIQDAAAGVYGVHISNVRGKNATVHCFSLRVLRNALLENLIADNCTGNNGIDLYTCSGCTLINPVCKNIDDYGIDITAETSQITIVGGNMSNCGTAVARGGITVRGDRNVIYGLICNNNNYCGVSVSGDDNTINIVCSDNAQSGMVLIGKRNHVSVVAKNNGDCGIDSSNVAAMYNTITGTISDNGGYGIRMSHASNNTVMNAIIDSNTGRGVGFRFADACNNTVKNCYFLNTNGGQTTHIGGYDGGSLWNNMLDNNFNFSTVTRSVLPTSPPSNPVSGVPYEYFITANQSIAVLYNGNTYYYEH